MFIVEFNDPKTARSFSRIIEALGFISEVHFDFACLDNWSHRVYARKSRLAEPFGTRSYDFDSREACRVMDRGFKALGLRTELVRRIRVAGNCYRIYVKE